MPSSIIHIISISNDDTTTMPLDSWWLKTRPKGPTYWNHTDELAIVLSNVIENV